MYSPITKAEYIRRYCFRVYFEDGKVVCMNLEKFITTSDNRLVNQFAGLDCNQAPDQQHAHGDYTHDNMHGVKVFAREVRHIGEGDSCRAGLS